MSHLLGINLTFLERVKPLLDEDPFSLVLPFSMIFLNKGHFKKPPFQLPDARTTIYLWGKTQFSLHLFSQTSQTPPSPQSLLILSEGCALYTHPYGLMILNCPT